MTDFQTKWKFGDRVIIDGDPSIKGTVTAFVFRVTWVAVEVSWFHNGESKCANFEDFRLTKVDAP